MDELFSFGLTDFKVYEENKAVNWISGEKNDSYGPKPALEYTPSLNWGHYLEIEVY